jgi:hypothetical protein
MADYEKITPLRSCLTWAKSAVCPDGAEVNAKPAALLPKLAVNFLAMVTLAALLIWL